MSDTPQIYVGGTQEHWLPFKVLEHSIRRHASGPVDVRFLWGLESKVPIPDHWKAKTPTTFSLQRFTIPELCRFAGRGVYLDSDQIVRADIYGLWNTPFPHGAKVLTTGGWQSAVAMFDCTIGWRVADLCNRMERGEFNYSKLSNLTFCESGLVTGSLDPLWNVIDRPDPNKMDVARAKLLHYTDMRLQPWLYDGHPAGAYWNTELREAIAAGFITVEDVLREIKYRNVRPSLALVVDEEPPYEDAQFVFPDERRKRGAA